MKNYRLMEMAGDRILRNVHKPSRFPIADATQYADLLYAGAKAEKKVITLEAQLDEIVTLYFDDCDSEAFDDAMRKLREKEDVG